MSKKKELSQNSEEQFPSTKLITVSELVKLLEDKDPNQFVMVDGYDGGFDDVSLREESVQVHGNVLPSKKKRVPHLGKHVNSKAGIKVIVIGGC